MGIRTATHQKATPFQVGRDGLAHHGGGLPARLHAVVVPDLGAIESQFRRRGDQPLVRQTVAGGVSQQHESPAARIACTTASALRAGPTTEVPCR